MSLDQAFEPVLNEGHHRSPIGMENYLCQYWRPEHCNPDNWTYQPSTYGVKGVELVGEKHMNLFSNLNQTWQNPGRVKTDNKSVGIIVDNIRDEGIKLDGRIIYYDVDTNERINGIHRTIGSEILSIPGWMMQGVRFANRRAKVKFALISNNEKKLHHLNSSPEDVMNVVRELINIDNEDGVTYSNTTVREEVDECGAHLSRKQRQRIYDKLIMEFRLNGAATCVEKFSDYNTKQVEHLLAVMAEDDRNAWASDYYFNEDTFTLYVNGTQFEARVGGIVSANVQAVKANKPLHIVYSVAIPEGEKNTLNTNRLSFWTTQMASIETRILESCGLQGDMHRRIFAWNHPDCEHRAVAQDNVNEQIYDLIKVRNRDFN